MTTPLGRHVSARSPARSVAPPPSPMPPARGRHPLQDCAISPAAPLLAVALVGGSLKTFTYVVAPKEAGGGGHGGSAVVSHTTGYSAAAFEDHSCRAAAFTRDGALLVAGSDDATIRLYDAASGKATAHYKEAHDAGVERLAPLGAPHLFASGDEAGAVKLWDARSKPSSACFYKYSKHTDYVSSFALHEADGCLVVASADGTLSVHDLAARKARARSEEDADDELLSVAVVKSGRKLLVGCQSGVLSLFSWGHFADCSDRYPGHPESVDALAAFDEDTVLTGSGDGAIRIVSVLPNRLLGVLGCHGELPVERLALAADR